MRPWGKRAGLKGWCKAKWGGQNSAGNPPGWPGMPCGNGMPRGKSARPGKNRKINY